ncbi:MAG: AMP-binding protein [Pyrinomonadaceae bacterium]
MAESFCERLVESFESRPEKTAMRIVGVEGNVYTWGEMLRSIRSIAYRLELEGVSQGDRVALIGENHPNWAIAYLGTLLRGAVIVPLDPHGEIETITNFLENSEARVAFLSPDQTERFQQIEEKLGRHIPAVIWSTTSSTPYEGGVDAASADGVVLSSIGDADKVDSQAKNHPVPIKNIGTPLLRKEGSLRHNFADWAATEFPAEFASRTPPARDEDMAVLMYTSGTTGTPKGVPLTHGNIVAELEGVNLVLKLSDTEKILSLLPLFHAYLQIVNMWIATTYGCEVGYLKELTPDELSKAMKEFKPTILTTVPRLWYLFHKKIFDAVAAKPKSVQRVFRAMLAVNGKLRDTIGVNIGRRLFSEVHEGFGGKLRVAISAGSRFDEDVAVDFHKLGFTILQGYGLTETSGAATATYEDDNRVGSVGKPMHGAEITIDNPDKVGIGEVLIKGPMVFKGYYQNDAANAEAFTDDGWFRSGDLGRIDKNGHLYIVGRGKDVIVLPSGKNVHPEDLEVHYLKCPLVAELAIIGVQDELESRAGAEKLAAVVVPDFDYLKQAKIANSKEAIRHELDSLGRSLPEYQRVRDYMIRSEPLPRTATRKIKRFQLKKEVETGEIAAEAKEARAWEFTPADSALIETNTARAVVAAIQMQKPARSKGAPDEDVVHPAMNLELDLGLDSLARAETFAALEQAFTTEFDGEEAATALTVANVIDLVNKHGGERADAVSVDLNWGKIVREADDDFPEVRGVLKDRPLFAAFAFVFYKLFNLFCRVFLLLEVKGLENLKSSPPYEGGVDAASADGVVLSSIGDLDKMDSQAKNHPVPIKSIGTRLLRKEGSFVKSFIICPNHQSFLDPFVVCSNYPYRIFKNIFHVGASEFFEGRILRFLATLLNVVPINPDTELMRAMKAGAIGLKHGKILNIYPEGERAFDGELHTFKKGAAILATELDVPIVPVAIDGLYKVWARKSWRIRPAKVKIAFGKPFYAKEIISGQQLVVSGASAGSTSSLVARPSSAGNDEEYAAVTAHLKQTIAAMIDEMRE